MLLNYYKCAVTINKHIFLPGKVVVTLHIGVELNLIPVCKTTPQQGITEHLASCWNLDVMRQK